MFIVLYGGKPNETRLTYLRDRYYIRLPTKNEIILASLPPTENAAKFHSYDTYQQIQTWFGNYLKQKNETGHIHHRSWTTQFAGVYFMQMQRLD